MGSSLVKMELQLKNTISANIMPNICTCPHCYQTKCIILRQYLTIELLRMTSSIVLKNVGLKISKIVFTVTGSIVKGL